jgi:hypothetical protein
MDAWELWNAAGTQWRVSAFAVIGLDYPAVFQLAEIYGITIIPALHQKIQVLERCTLEQMRKETMRE